MCGANHNTRRYKPDSVCDVTFLITAQIEFTRYFSCFDAIGVIKTCHTRSCYEVLISHFGKHGICKHCFAFRIIKCFADDVNVLQKHCGIIFRNALCVRFKLDIRIDFPKVIRQSIRFIHTDLRCLILLTVEIGNIHTVKINEYQPSDTCSCERYGDIRAKTAKTAYCNRCR